MSQQVVMELGGNAPCIVDDYVPDLDYTIQRLINGGFYQGGQSCIHMQRLYVHERLYDEVRTRVAGLWMRDIVRTEGFKSTDCI